MMLLSQGMVFMTLPSLLTIKSSFLHEPLTKLLAFAESCLALRDSSFCGLLKLRQRVSGCSCCKARLYILGTRLPSLGLTACSQSTLPCQSQGSVRYARIVACTR